jgi:uncharacterized protein YvpB
MTKFRVGLLVFLSLVLFNGYMVMYLVDDVRQYSSRSKVTGYDSSIRLEHDAEPYSVNRPNTKVELEDKPISAMVDAVAIMQHPELYNGCEVTALSMLLQHAGIQKDKMELADELVKDSTPIVHDQAGNIASWGNSDIGFVGDITGRSKGLGVNHKPLFRMLKNYIPKALNLSGNTFGQLELSVSRGVPVVVWTTVSFVEPKESQWLNWNSSTGQVRATFQMHAVLLVGYDEHYVYVNDPQTGEKGKAINKSTFMQSWGSMGNQALSYRK